MQLLYLVRIEDLGQGDFRQGGLRRLPPRRAADAGGAAEARARQRSQGAQPPQFLSNSAI
jgi:hypothetical protein